MEPIEAIAGKLRELDLPTEEIDALAPVALLFSRGQPPEPTAADTRQLVQNLSLAMPTRSPVRQAIRAHQQRHGASVSWLLATAHTQVSLFGLDFWLVSALVTLVGAVVVLSNVSNGLSGQELLLRASGPLLAYLGTTVAFRGTRGRVLEFELACLPSPVQLALARLVIVLGYDFSLGLALALALWAGGTAQVLALLLSWFMPLLLVAGLALLLSLRFSVQTAAALAYGSWLAVLAIDTNSTLQVLPLTPLSDALLGGLGLALLAIVLLRLQTNMHRLLPRV
jgi:hypothetical protein